MFDHKAIYPIEYLFNTVMLLNGFTKFGFKFYLLFIFTVKLFDVDFGIFIFTFLTKSSVFLSMKTNGC